MSPVMHYLEITIPIAATWPSSDELGARNSAEAGLNATGIGICTGAGGGMGKMHLTFRVPDEASVSAARAAIEQAMKIHMPHSAYDVKIHE